MASTTTKVVKGLVGLRKKAKKLSSMKAGEKLKKEREASKRLHEDCQATLHRMCEKDNGLRKALDDAYGYAVFPSIGRAGLVLGGSYGRGEVYKKGKLIGYAAAIQLTIGVQVGGITYGELVLFQDQATLKRFKASKIGFAANAAAVIVKAGAAAANNYQNGMQTFVQPDGGLLVDLDIGGQKLIYRPAALTRGKSAEMSEEQQEGAHASA